MSNSFREGLLGYLLARASQAVSRGFSGVLKANGLNVRQWRVLGSLWDVESLTLGDLADAILCEQSSTTRLVDRLSEAGLVGKRADSDDRRKVHVYLTEEGRGKTAELIKQAMEVEQVVAEGYGIENAEALKTELHTLIKLFYSPLANNRDSSSGED